MCSMAIIKQYTYYLHKSGRNLWLMFSLLYVECIGELPWRLERAVICYVKLKASFFFPKWSEKCVIFLNLFIHSTQFKWMEHRSFELLQGRGWKCYQCWKKDFLLIWKSDLQYGHQLISFSLHSNDLTGDFSFLTNQNVLPIGFLKHKQMHALFFPGSFWKICYQI